MKKTKHQSKLALSQETVRSLHPTQLPKIGGGAGTNDTKLPPTGSGEGCLTG